MRNLPHKKTKRQDLIIRVVFDFYGPGIQKKDEREAKKIALYLMGRRRGISLNEEQMEKVWCIRKNLQDPPKTS